MRITTRHTLAALAIAAVATFGLAACSSPSSAGDENAAAETNEPMPSATAETTDSAMDPAADLVGPGCAAYAAQVPDGPGSVVGMSADPVAVAASNNPLLTTLVAAVSGQLNPEVNLVDTLNGDEFTVFAPVDDAFAKIDAATLESLKTPEGAATLTSILTYHVVPGQIAPDAIAGTQTTVEGGTVTVTGSGDSMKVNDANVICGGVHTANATVYLIDSVLMPPM
ncbi:fasciclin domain-containing protein [Compostimonas suwonensis]|uniref:Putative surface protein with fasciclin (FAS1) repeats n=1 Tax=Compostimonas suwonensis TaxID=1048394 RepID=A0A2M9BWW6_9MICO|nr:fasciclin domain-containing protein [Compostimonas suwonensis]PJJ62438.1 putative surface protein with fasciclin (FAS1) repeats [Compostimonas suwonensis]